MRDLLLGWQPKDFDVATSARPRRCAALFRRSRIIGRRFRLVHVMCGRRRSKSPLTAAGVVRGRRRPAARRARPHPARQRVRHPGAGRAAPRLHASTRFSTIPRRRRSGTTPRRRGSEEAAASHDRRSRAALPRRSGAHAARGALRGEARRRDRAHHTRADQSARAAAAERAGRAPVRRDAEAPAVGPRARVRHARCARKACIMACCRCSM